MGGVGDMVSAAKAGVQGLDAAQVAEEIERDDVVLLDVREPTETADGVIPGAVLAPRGMLEFHADPQSPYHLEALDPGKRVVLYCAGGARSALAAQTLQQMGYTDVAHLDGGFGAWTQSGRPTEQPG